MACYNATVTLVLTVAVEIQVDARNCVFAEMEARAAFEDYRPHLPGAAIYEVEVGDVNIVKRS